MEYEKLKEMILAVLYETAWEEEIFDGQSIIRTWKTYPFEIMDELDREGLINNSKRAKSITLTPEGVERAKKILVGLEEK